jgi:hypothetical protein
MPKNREEFNSERENNVLKREIRVKNEKNN